jgi:hypothetical protein
VYRFEQWLLDEARWRAIPIFLGIVLVAQHLYMFCITNFFSFFHIGPFGTLWGGIGSLPLPAFIVVASLVEESLFRFFPLVLSRIIAKHPLEITLLIAVASSIVFGFIHGGIVHIFVQGVLGFIWCILFLKCGGNHDNPLKALFVTWTSHALYNFVLLGLAALHVI